jgi:hypothetical protein
MGNLMNYQCFGSEEMIALRAGNGIVEAMAGAELHIRLGLSAKALENRVYTHSAAEKESDTC